MHNAIRDWRLRLSAFDTSKGSMCSTGKEPPVLAALESRATDEPTGKQDSMKIQRLFPNLVVDDLAADRAALEALFDLERAFESDWFVQLRSPCGSWEIGLLKRGGRGTPESIAGPPGGVSLTVVVDNVDEIEAAARAAGIRVIEPSRDRFYGQRQLLLGLPSGAVLDVSAPCDPDPEWVTRVGPDGSGGFVESS